MYEDLMIGLDLCARGEKTGYHDVEFCGLAYAAIKNLNTQLAALQAENGSLRAQHRTEHCEAAGYDCVELGRLRDALASVEAERDALLEAVESGKDCAYCIVGNGGREPQCEASNYCCDGCADIGCRCHDCTDGSRFQWRGAQGGGVSMENLVYWNCKEKGSALPVAINEDGDTADLETLCARLASYEATGLEPEDCMAYPDVLELRMYRSIGSIPELKAMKEARDDGREVVLPCKVGDTIYSPQLAESAPLKEMVCCGYRIYDGGINVMCREPGIGFPLIFTLGKTAYLTRAEAEAALERGVQT